MLTVLLRSNPEEVLLWSKLVKRCLRMMGNGQNCPTSMSKCNLITTKPNLIMDMTKQLKVQSSKGSMKTSKSMPLNTKKPKMLGKVGKPQTKKFNKFAWQTNTTMTWQQKKDSSHTLQHAKVTQMHANKQWSKKLIAQMKSATRSLHHQEKDGLKVKSDSQTVALPSLVTASGSAITLQDGSISSQS